MSSILSDSSTSPFLENTLEDGGLDVIGRPDSSNFFFVEGNGNDLISGGFEFDRLDGGDGDDFIAGLNGDDQLIGGDGDDTLIGGEGNDLLDGDLGDDVLIGGDGDDVLIGDGGVDIMTGGAGNDIFQFSAENLISGEIDKITDFEDGSGQLADVIELNGIGSDAVVEYDSQTGLISVNGEDFIQLDAGLDISADNTDGNDNWELF
jgi:Ca2+-binding RTX toxin-like protein